MAAKNLSVRFSAEGLDEVRKGLKALGEDGAKALKAIEDGASKGASRELDLLERKLGGLERQLDPTARAAQRLAEAQSLQTRALAAGAQGLDRYADVVKKAEAAHGAMQAAFGRTTAQAATVGNAVRLQGYQWANLGQQVQDVAVSLAGGQNPFLVAIQQGPQAAFAVGGFANAMGLLGGVIRAHPILAIGSAVAAAVGGYLLLRDTTNQVTSAIDAYSEAVAKSNALTLTSAEQSKKAAEAKEIEARAELQKALALNRTALAEEEAARKRAEGVLDRLNSTPGASAEGTQRAAQTLGALAEQATATAERVAYLEGEMRKLNQRAPVLSDIAKALIAVEDAYEAAHRPDIDAALKRRGEILAGLKQPIDLHTEALRKLQLAQQDLAPSEFTRSLENLNNWLYQTSPAFAAMRAEIEKTAKAYAALEAEQEKAHTPDVAADLKRRESILRTLRTPMDEYVDQVRELNIAYAKGDVVGEAYERRLENLNQWLHEQDPAFQQAKKAAEDYARALERIVDRTADRLVDFGADAFFDAMTGKSTSFWKTFEEQGKRALAQMAAEALIRPIILPIVQSVVGGAPGLFGLPSGAAQAASGGNQMMNLFGGLRNLFSPDNFIANAFPSIFGPGLAGGAAISAGLLGPGGMALGGGATSSLAIGTAAGPLAGLAPFLPVLAFALPMLFSMFGGKKSVGPNGNAIINWERDAEGRLTNPGGLAIGGLGADNGGDKDYARSMAEAATKGFNAIVDRLGGRALGVPGAGQSGQLELGYFAEGNKHFSVVGGEREEFGSAEQAVANFIKRALQQGTVEGLSADVREAIKRTKASSAEELGKDIEFAYGFRRTVDLAAAGPGTRAAQLLGFQYAGQDQANALMSSNRDFVRNAGRLFGEDSTQYSDAKATVLRSTLAAIGLGPDGTGANAPLEGRAAALAEAEAKIKSYRDTLIDAGLTAAEADTKIAEATARADEQINRAFDWLDDLEDFQKSAGALSVDIARWAYEANQGAQDVAEAEQAAADAKAEYVDALNREISAQQAAADAYGRIADAMKKTRLGFLLDPNLSPLSPGDRLTEANRQFNDIYGRALNGDIKAGDQLPDIARALLEAERSYSASSPAYVQTFNKVQTALQNTETLAERQAKIANEQLTTLRSQLSELQTQGGHIKTVAEAAEAYKQAQGAATTANQNRPSPGAIGEQQFQAFGTLAGRFQGLYAGATTEAQRAQVYSTAANQRDALINAITDVPTLQRILDVFYRSQPDEQGANVIRTRLYSLGAVPAFAEGGIVDRPTLGWIAEAGRSEAVVPLSRGRSIPVEMRDVRAPTVTNDNRGVEKAIRDLAVQQSSEMRALREEVSGLRAENRQLRNTLVELESRQPRRRLAG